jgi:hypothetical protein
VYLDGEYYNVFQHGTLYGLTPVGKKKQNIYDSALTIPEKKMREVLIHFPLYNQVDDLFIGLDKDAKIEPPGEYAIQKPIVFYGSSITQGACASHP